MFDIEHAIANWRKQMSTAGIRSTAVIEELETHLREDIDREVRLGAGAEQAFLMATQNMGKPAVIKAEFKKTGTVASILERLMIGVCCVLVGFITFLSVAAILMCFEGWQERTIATLAIASVLVVACTWRYFVPLLPVIRSTRVRWGVGLVCIATGFIVSSVFCGVILPHFVRGDEQRFEVALWALLAIAIFACAGVGLLLDEDQRASRGMLRARS